MRSCSWQKAASRATPPPRLPWPSQNSHPHKPSVSRTGAFQLHSHLVPPPRQLASCPWSRLEEPTLNLEPPSWSRIMKAQSSYSSTRPARRCPHLQHHHQVMELRRRRRSDHGKNSPMPHCPVPSCPFIPSLSLVGLRQGSANLFSEEPESKYFHLYRPHGLCCNYSRMTCLSESSHRE